MSIGRYNKMVDVQAPTRAPDGMGGFTVTHTTKYSGSYVYIWPIGAKEQIQADQSTMVATHRIGFRQYNLLRAGWRIKYGNRYFDIVSIINPNEANKMLELLCNEVVV